MPKGKSTARVPDAVIDLEDYVESHNFLIHSDTGAGKTVLAANLPDCLILAIEKGTISAKRRGSKAKVWKIKTWAELIEAFEWLRDTTEAGTCPFKWVVIDSLTAAQVKCLRAIMDKVVADNPSRDPDIPAPGDHFKWQLLMKRMVLDFVEMDINVCFLAQSMQKEDPDGEDIILPLIEGKDYQISAWVCAQVHLLAYLKKTSKGKGDDRRVTRRLYVNDHPMYWCKDRYDVLGRYIDNPDIVAIVRKVEAVPPKKRSA